MNNLNSTNIYNFLLVYMPLLYIYKSPVPGVDWGTALVVLFAIFFYGRGRRHGGKLSKALVAVLVYSVVCTLVNLVIGTTNYSSLTSIFLRTGRFVVVMVVMMVFGYSNHFVPKKYLKLLRGLTLFVSGYAILQSLAFRLTGIKLINVIGPVTEDIALSSETMYRPPSIFLEPSHAAYFMAPYLCYVLFCNPATKKNKKRRFREAILISLGILFTTSGLGLTVLALTWGIWLVRSAKKLHIKSIIILICVFIFMLYNFDFNATINRITTNDEQNAVEARQVGYSLLEKLPLTYQLFGTGYGNYDDRFYYSSFAEIIFCTGYIGLFLVLILFLTPLLKGHMIQKALSLSCVLLMMGGGIYTASYLCLYLPLLLYKGWYKVKI